MLNSLFFISDRDRHFLLEQLHSFKGIEGNYGQFLISNKKQFAASIIGIGSLLKAVDGFC